MPMSLLLDGVIEKVVAEAVAGIARASKATSLSIIIPLCFCRRYALRPAPLPHAYAPVLRFAPTIIVKHQPLERRLSKVGCARLHCWTWFVLIRTMGHIVRFDSPNVSNWPALATAVQFA